MTKDKQIAMMRECIEFYADKENWGTTHEWSDADSCLTIIDPDEEKITTQMFIGGKRAREVLSSLPAPQTESEDQKAREWFFLMIDEDDIQIFDTRESAKKYRTNGAEQIVRVREVLE